MPMRKEVKLELKQVEKNIKAVQSCLSLKNIQECKWHHSSEEQISSKVLSLLYMLRTINDPVVEQLALHSLLFIVFSCFVRSKTYNSMERTLLKFFLEKA